MRDMAVQKLPPYSLNELMVLTVQHLYVAYTVAVEDIPGEVFIEKILKPLPGLDSRKSDQPLENQPLEILLQYATDEVKAKGNDAIARAPVSPILLSATYYFRAGRARDNNQTDAAWSYLAEARYWCGVAMAGKGLESALQQAAGSLKRDMAAAGAKGRSGTYQPLRDLAFDFARNNAPPSGWRSRNHAVQSVRSRVLQQAKTLKIKVSEQNIEKTIDGWLATMPDEAQLFSKGK
ncbi:Uncharacterised protein [Burkholderia pseudomallei]|nr:Uncharacterised protein [Burkholderia pseudomallei]CAJ4639585.1 Uncharacterised protein [Burkholderia pseudomallei]CAJ7257605.1 Uncharacterised protein [Burkholderia pseudomallei]